MIVCQCTGVTDSHIARLIEAGATTLPEIVRQCGAGRCCAPCRDEIRAMLDRGDGPSFACDQAA